MTQKSTNSQELFRNLELSLRELMPRESADLSGSFQAFCKWLQTNHPEMVTRAAEIAADVRLWRDTQDVIRQLWEHIYRG